MERNAFSPSRCSQSAPSLVGPSTFVDGLPFDECDRARRADANATPKDRTASDRSDRAKVRRLSRRRIPCSSRIAHPSVACTPAPGWNPREPTTCAPGGSGRDLSRPSHFYRLPVPRLPAKGAAFSRKPRCVRPTSTKTCAGSPPRPPEWAPRPRDPRPRVNEGARLCDQGCLRLCLRPRMPSVTRQALGGGPIRRRGMKVGSTPPPAPRPRESQRPRRSL